MADVFDKLVDEVLSHKNREVLDLLERGKLYDNVVDEVRGRKVRIGDRWITG